MPATPAKAPGTTSRAMNDGPENGACNPSWRGGDEGGTGFEPDGPASGLAPPRADLDPVAGPRQVLTEEADVRGPVAVEGRKREDTDLASDSAQFLERRDGEVQIKLLGVEEQEVRDDKSPECT